MKRYSKIIEIVAGGLFLLGFWLIKTDKPTTWQFVTLVIAVILIGISGYYRYSKK